MKGAIYYLAIAKVIFSHVKITCYFHLWRYRVFARKLTWYFIGVYIIKDYSYLGTPISSSGNFTLSLEHLRQKAFMLFLVRRDTDFSKLKPSLASKIFDTMISLISTYNWSLGCLCEIKVKSWDSSGVEKNHLHFW